MKAKESSTIQTSLLREMAMKSTKEVGKTISHMDKEHIAIHLEPFTKVNGLMVNMKDKVHMNSQMGVFMLGNGSIKKCMGKDCILIKKVLNGKAFLLMVFTNQNNKEN